MLPLKDCNLVQKHLSRKGEDVFLQKEITFYDEEEERERIIFQEGFVFLDSHWTGPGFLDSHRTGLGQVLDSWKTIGQAWILTFV